MFSSLVQICKRGSAGSGSDVTAMASQSFKLHGCVGAFFSVFNVLFRDLERNLAGVRCVWLGAIAHSSRTVQLCEEMGVLHLGHILEFLDSSGAYVCAHRIASGDMAGYFEHVLQYSERNSKTTVCRDVRITCAGRLY